MSFRTLLFILFSLWKVVHAQPGFKVNGKISDMQDDRISIPGCIVVNMRTQQGMLAGEDGSFSVSVLPTDTLAFRSIGYELKFVYPASIHESELLHVRLKRQPYQLKEVTIIPHRNLDSISKDISKLGFDESNYRLQGVDAIESPFTALYQAFSRKERSKRQVAFMLNEDQRKQLLRELLQYYVSCGFIRLHEKDFNRFIDFCAINEAQLKTLTQYEMAVYIKKKYEIFK